MIVIKSAKEIELMREAGQIVAETLLHISKMIKPGVTTGQLDNLAKNYIKKNNAKPAFLGYRGFPANICTSINHEVVHGIPGLRRLSEGDIISIDVGVSYKGYFGDAACTFPVGEVSPLARRLIDVTKDSLLRGIKNAVLGNRLYDISHSIQSFVEEHGFSVVRSFVGHGIGSAMHEEPQVPNYGRPGKGVLLEEGMVLAIEPMVNTGTWEVKTLADQWTVVTRDKGLSAHFEHTVAIMKNGPEILTTL